MNQVPYNITPDLQITECKPISGFRFRVTFMYEKRIEAQAIYGFRNSRYTSLAVQTSITENVLENIDEALEENQNEIGKFLKVQEEKINNCKSN